MKPETFVSEAREKMPSPEEVSTLEIRDFVAGYADMSPLPIRMPGRIEYRAKLKNGETTVGVINGSRFNGLLCGLFNGIERRSTSEALDEIAERYQKSGVPVEVSKYN